MRNFLLAISFVLSSSVLFGQTYFLNGSAFYLGGDCYLLTPAIGTMNGTVWYADQIDLNQPFDLQFTMNFGTLDDNGADGMCFVLQTVGTNAIGTSGGGMGYQDFGTSLGIEFDTYQNGNFGDPSEDHIAIEYNGNINHGASTGHISGPVQASATNVNIEDGEDHIVRITWNPETHIVEVYFDCEFRLQGETDLINDIFGGESLVYWGFTAATGGSYNNQSVCLRDDILNVSEVSVCEGGSITLDVAGSLDGVYSWTPADYLSDAASPNPVASPPVTTVYTVSYLDICGTLTESEVTVSVEELEVSAANTTLLSCLVPETSLTAQTNFNSDLIEYTWSLDGEVIASGTNLSNLTINTGGVYLIEANIDDVCFADFTLVVNSNYSEYTINAGNDLVLDCNNETVTIQAQTTGGSNVVWFHDNSLLPDQTSLTLETDDPGIYTVTTTHPVSGCITEDSVNITQDYTTPSLEIGEQDSLSCVRPSVNIKNVLVSSVNAFSVSWSTTIGNIASFGNTVSPVFTSMGDYTITVTDNVTGCSTSETIFINESSDFNFRLDELAFPNIITPNTDALNSFWRPYSMVKPELDVSKVFSVFELTVFNRWGKKIFETNQFYKQWDANEDEDGTYFYILRYEAYCVPGDQRETHGYVQVSR